MTKETPELLARKQEIVALVSAFCDECLTSEYQEICRRLIEKMARKRDVPFLRGQPASWAAGIVHAVGTVNFLFARDSELGVRSAHVARFFGISHATMSAKSSTIRAMYRMDPLDMEFATAEHRNSFQPMIETMELVEAMLEEERESRPPRPRRRKGEFVDIPRDAEGFAELAVDYDFNGPSEPILAALRGMVEADPDFLKPYLLLRDGALEKGDEAEARGLLDVAYRRAVCLMADQEGHWPSVLRAIWPENGHIIAALYDKAVDAWQRGDMEEALSVLGYLLHADPDDPLDVRHFILAIRMGMDYWDFDEMFESSIDPTVYDEMKISMWFAEHINDFPDEFAAWKKAVHWED